MFENFRMPSSAPSSLESSDLILPRRSPESILGTVARHPMSRRRDFMAAYAKQNAQKIETALKEAAGNVAEAARVLK
jgi:hypothetical protein